MFPHDVAYLEILRGHRFGIRTIDTGVWFTYLDGEGHIRPFITMSRAEAVAKIDKLGGPLGAGSEWWETAEISEVEMRRLSTQLLPLE